MVPWSGCKVLVWDATCLDTLAPSYSSLVTREAGAVAEETERRKKAKYSHLERLHCFIPVAVETLGVFGPEARYLVKDLGRRIAHATVEPLSIHYIPATENFRSSAEGRRCGYSELHQYGSLMTRD